MSPHHPLDDRPPSEAVDARVRRALDATGTTRSAARDAVLARIAGRSPEAVNDEAAAVRIRTLAQAAAVLLFVLSMIAARSGSTSKESRVDGSNVVAVVTPQDSDESATKEGVFAELFAVEVPE